MVGGPQMRFEVISRAMNGVFNVVDGPGKDLQDAVPVGVRFFPCLPDGDGAVCP